MKFISTFLLFSLLAILTGCSTLSMDEPVARSASNAAAPTPASAVVNDSIQIPPKPVFEPIYQFIPMSTGTFPELTPLKTVDPKDLECISKTMYFEAKGEPTKGIVAVGHVILNRTKDARFPKTICGVVRQGKYVNGKPVAYKCQFHWICSGKSEKINDKTAYAKIEALARSVLTGEAPNPVCGSLFFHATYVKAKWDTRKMVKYKVGRHIFYA